MATDFRADQIRFNRLISSGSTPILVYPSSSASDLAGGQTAEFVTSSVGIDVFFFVSGATDGTGKSLFGGDAVVSGNVRIDQSLAQGNSVVASGLYSHAQGSSTNATNFYTHAEGISTTASGLYAHAEGNLTTASGVAAHAEGLGSQASGNYSHAEGDSVTASGQFSHAEGSGSISSGKYSHAEGDLTTASGMYSHTEGTGVSANGTASHAEGTFTIANGDYSHAEGSGASTYGSSSHAEGFAATSIGDFSHAEGAFCISNGLYSHAEGFFTLAHGEASHAEGFGSEAIGTGSFAAGLYTVASGSIDGSSPTTVQAVFGKYNLQGNTDSLFVIGDGFDVSNRRDVFRVSSGSVQVSGSFQQENILATEVFTTDLNGDGNITNPSNGLYFITGSNDSSGNGWSYIKYQFAQETKLTLKYDWDVTPDSVTYDWPFYVIRATEPIGDLGVGNPGTDFGSTYGNLLPYSSNILPGQYKTITVPAGDWFGIGVYSVDSQNGPAKLKLEIFKTDVSIFNGDLTVNSDLIVTGSLIASKITGSIQNVDESNTIPFLTASTNITLNYNSSGQWEITGSGGGGGGTQKQFVAKYEETTSTSPVVIGQFSWVPSDYASLTTLRVRAIMSTDGTANHTGSLQIYNLTSGSYIDLIDTPSINTTFNITSSIPTLVTSSNLLSGVTNFDNSSTSIYELRISGSSANSTIVGGVELVYS